MSEYEIQNAIRPAAERLLREVFDPRSDGFVMLDGKETITDYLAHIDVICHTASRQYWNIRDQIVLTDHTISIDVKIASYRNWHIDGWTTCPFSQKLLTHGQNTLMMWCYANEQGDEIDSWIVALWKSHLANQIFDNFDRYRNDRIHRSRSRSGGNFWYIPLQQMLTFFNHDVLACELRNLGKKFENVDPNDLEHKIKRHAKNPTSSQMDRW